MAYNSTVVRLLAVECCGVTCACHSTCLSTCLVSVVQLTLMSCSSRNRMLGCCWRCYAWHSALWTHCLQPIATVNYYIWCINGAPGHLHANTGFYVFSARCCLACVSTIEPSSLSECTDAQATVGYGAAADLFLFSFFLHVSPRKLSSACRFEKRHHI